MNPTEAARHIGMSEVDLRDVNNIPPRMLIKAGSTLLVPRSAKMEYDVTSAVADNAQVSLTPEIVTRRTTVKARKGETVAAIAKRFGLSAPSVAAWNSVGTSAAFKLGHQVVVFLPVKSSASSAGRSHIKAVKRSTSRAIVKSKKRR
jgi:membrane-bound lytic murein transglycosylase D